MKKIVVSGVMILGLVVALVVINKVTYSIYKSNTAVSVSSTSDKLVCNAILSDDDKSTYGYKKLLITVNNFEDQNNEEVVTDVPLKYNFTVSGPTGSKFRIYADPASGRIIQNGAGFTETNSITLPSSSTYDEFTTTKTSNQYIVEVMTSSDGTAAQEEEFSVALNCSQVIPPAVITYTVGEEVYFNPVNGGDTNICNSSNSGVSPTGNCMTFNVIKDNGDTVLLMLDHNIVNKVAWVTQEDYNDNANWGQYGNSDKGAITANNALEGEVSTWNNVQTIKNEKNQDVKARMITYDEIKAIPNVTDNGSYLSTLPSWLLRNTSANSTGATNNIYGSSNLGYWTSTSKANNPYAFYVYIDGNSNIDFIIDGNRYGVRPVISVLKSKLQSSN